ncbi:MAG: conjugal transfer protein TraF [bacterium]
MYRRVMSYCIIISAITAFLALPSHAIEFQPLGFEAASMGGAGVATAKGSFAPYYNPALLPEHINGFQMSVSTGVGIRELNIVDHIDTLADIDIDENIEAVENVAFDLLMIAALVADGTADAQLGDPEPTARDIATIKQEIRSLASFNGVQIMPSLSVGMQVGNFGLGVYGISEGTAYAVIDPDYLDIIVGDANSAVPFIEYDEQTDLLIVSDQNAYEASSLQYALEEGIDYLKITGLAYMEIPVAYGHKFTTYDWGDINCGASFKLMPGYTYDQRIDLDTASGDLEDEMTDAQNSDMSWGIDLGVLYKPKAVPKLSLGLVAKNINTPKFETATGDHFKVNPQVRFGCAYDFWGDRITMALDMDLTANETFIPGYDSQMIGGGINFHPFSWISLRAGAMSNMKESVEGTVLTGGLSIGVKWLQIDLAGQYATKQGEFDGNSIPKYSKVQFALVSKWF